MHKQKEKCIMVLLHIVFNIIGKYKKVFWIGIPDINFFIGQYDIMHGFKMYEIVPKIHYKEMLRSPATGSGFSSAHSQKMLNIVSTVNQIYQRLWNSNVNM